MMAWYMLLFYETLIGYQLGFSQQELGMIYAGCIFLAEFLPIIKGD